MEKTGKVFMLDDDRFALDVFNEMLGKRGYEVFATDNAYEFVRYAKEIIPDVFILDINMPQTSGWEILQYLKNDDTLQKIPVVMFTVNQDADLAFVRGAAHFLHKPMDLEYLFDIIESYCRGGKAHDVLLFADYYPEYSILEQSIAAKRLSCFAVHDIDAGIRYLSLNTPRIVCLAYNENKYSQIRPLISHNNVVRAAITQRIDEISPLVD